MFLEDLKRLDIDDVKNSEYIEEDIIRKYSFDQRSQLFRDSNVIASSHAQEDILFRFQTVGGPTDKFKNSQLNRSQDPLDDSRRVSTGGRIDFDNRVPKTTR
jgi:hypothetical protein